MSNSKSTGDVGVGARRSAIYLLDQILGEGRLMSELIGAGALDRLPAEDRARAQRLALDTLRGLERADRLLQRHLRKKPSLTVQNALRVGTVELCQGGAAHGVVNAMVQIIGADKRNGQLKGLVNAVLRKIAAEGPQNWEKLRVPRLPKWLRRPLVEAWGSVAVGGMEAAHFQGAPLDITPMKDAGRVAGSLGATVLPSGTLRLHEAGQVTALEGYKGGNWWIQDAAAALPARILAPLPGEAVLDMCAAPGGKTMQLASSGATVTAVDNSDSRLARLHENLERTGLKATVKVSDAVQHHGAYDAILLDAPCSATGTIRRHPDLPFAKDGSEFGELIDLQSQMLDHMWSLLRIGGRMVFCTCSLLPDEGEVQIEEALSRHSDMQVDRDALGVSGVSPDWITPEGGLRLRPDYWPELGGMDGFYIAVLRKIGG
ncbi:MAG: RsmB/NOP family class I SAM-dependent RNA methyltransferase [Paracoccaceae bacterium]